MSWKHVNDKKASSKSKSAAAKTKTSAPKPTGSSTPRKTKPAVLITKCAILAVLAIALFIASLWTNEIEKFVNYTILHNDGGTVHTFDNGLQVHFIDVGQADAICVLFPDGRTMMVDSGDNNTESRTNMKNYLDKYIFAETPAGQEPVINWFLLTHSDADHVGGAAVLFDNYKIETVYRPATFTLTEHAAVTKGEAVYGETFTSGYYTLHTTVAFRTFAEKAAAEKSNVIFHKNAADITIDGVEINFFPPKEIYYGDKDSYSKNEGAAAPESSDGHAINSQCPYVMLTYMNKKIMLTGDATSSNEEEWMDANHTLSIDVLKVQHHGSADGNHDYFFKNLFHPTLENQVYAVISVGTNNYNHPNPAVLANIESAGVPKSNILQTLTNGNIVANVNSAGDLFFGTDVSTPQVWVAYWPLALTVFIVVAAALMTNEIARLVKLRKQISKDLNV